MYKVMDICLLVILIAWCNAETVNTTSNAATNCSSLPLTLPHGTVHSFDDFPRALGSTIFFSCEENYRLVGPRDMVCKKRGWSTKRRARCKLRRCIKPGYLEYGRYHGSHFTVGSDVFIFCNSGFRVFGSKKRTCRVDGKWSGNLTTCDDGKWHCPNPGIPIGSTKTGKRYNSGNIITYSCRYGLALKGSKTRRCQRNGKWTGITPICIDTKIPPVSIVAKRLKDNFIKPLMATTCSSREGDCSAINETNSVTNDSYRLRAFQRRYKTGLDLIFLLDASSSVKEQYFKLGLELIKVMVQQFGISDANGTKIACVTFGTASYLEFSFAAESVSTTAKAIDRISRIKFRGGGTATREALDMIRKDIMAMTRKDSKKAIMFVTDGNSNIGGRPASAARKLKRQGVEIYVIGVGSTVKKEELKSIASFPYEDHVFMIEHQSDIEILIESIIDFSECGRDLSTYRSRVVGGKYSQPGKWPWALFLVGTEGICGASLLNKRWALTAGHCIVPQRASQFNSSIYPFHTPAYYKVYLGLTDFEKDEKQRIEVDVKDVFVHQNFIGEPLLWNDIALIKLAENPRFKKYTKYIQRICLPDKTLTNRLSSGGITVGWGSTKKREFGMGADAGSETLKEVFLPFVNDSVCKQRTVVGERKYNEWLFDNKTMFCAGNGKGVNDTCYGDSGSPMMVKQYDKDLGVYRWYQVGINSWGIGCASKGDYAYLTKVTTYLDWIRDTIKDNTP